MIVNPFRKKDIDRRKRSSNLFAGKEDEIKKMNKRLKILVVVIALLFISITARLVQLQVFDHDLYTEKALAFSSKKQSFTPSRGNIYDRNGVVLAESKKLLSVIYYPKKDITNKEEWELAKKFVDEVGIELQKTNTNGTPVDLITERQLKDMYYNYESTFNGNNFNDLLTEEEIKKANKGEIKNSDLYEMKIERMKLPELDEMTKKQYLAMMLMNQAPESEFKTILESATSEQVAYIVEHSSQFPGFMYMNDWDRVYYDNNNDIIKSVLGSVSSSTQGLPQEDMEYYMALGYSMNQRIGISGLEKQYEDWLSGTKRMYNIEYDKDTGLPIKSEESNGKKGYNLNLTLDIELQKKATEIMQEILARESSLSKKKYFDSLYLVAMNPKNGEVLAMPAVKKDEEGNIYAAPTGNYLDVADVGSVVKMATLYMGLQEGVVKPGDIIVDQPMHIKGTETFASYRNHGAIDDINAIAVSSNVYMANIAIRLAGGTYKDGEPLVYTDGTFEKMRAYYTMFGLGVKTGLDVPVEEVGSIGGTDEFGKILHLAIGQYDTYTTMQLAQYVATIANGGKRVQPHLLKEVTEVNDPESIVYESGTDILSTLLGTNVSEYVDRLKQGMHGCVFGTPQKPAPFCPAVLNPTNSGTEMAAKTGTADSQVNDNGTSVKVTNSSLVSFAPYNDPEIVFACVAPRSEITSDSLSSNVCAEVVGRVSKYYFENKK